MGDHIQTNKDYWWDGILNWIYSKSKIFKYGIISKTRFSKEYEKYWPTGLEDLHYSPASGNLWTYRTYRLRKYKI